MEIQQDRSYPGLKEYAKEMGTSPDLLIEAFHLENLYHKKLNQEKDQEKRELLYQEFYSKLLQFYGRNASDNTVEHVRSKDPQVKLFGRDLKNKSIIDFGCGEGSFLLNIKENLPYKSLTGV